MKRSSSTFSSKLGRLVVVAIIFVLMGEALIRMDQAILHFGIGLKEVALAPRDTPLFRAVEAGTHVVRSDVLRIMVLGDSVAFGAGVADSKTFAAQLEEALTRRPLKAGGAEVLNLSTASNNMRTNKEDFEAYVDRFRPDLTILAYNTNDVYMSGREARRARKTSKQPTGSIPSKRRMTLKNLLRLLMKNSATMAWALPRMNSELKYWGFLIPGSTFYHLVEVSHTPKFPRWKQVVADADTLVDGCARRGIRLIVYLVPEMNLVRNYSVLSKPLLAITAVFQGLQVLVVDGITPFLEEEGIDYRDYALSRYDGHPNTAAHNRMSEHLDSVVRSIYQAGHK